MRVVDVTLMRVLNVTLMRVVDATLLMMDICFTLKRDVDGSYVREKLFSMFLIVVANQQFDAS